MTNGMEAGMVLRQVYTTAHVVVCFSIKFMRLLKCK